MADPYLVLGVARDAPQDAIRKAYLQLAKKSHPDLHPGDKTAEARFKEISGANDIIGDEKQRARFDSGEIDAGGIAKAPMTDHSSYRRHAEAHPDFKYEQHWNGDGDLDDQDLFAGLFGRRRGATRQRGADVNYTYAVELPEAITGAKKRIVLADGKTIDITIPPGLKDGQTLRLRGQGSPGHGDAASGDALVEVHVKPHPMFRRDGDTITSILSVTMGEALAGARIRVPTITGNVELSVPKGSNTGKILRLRGKGAPSPAGPGNHLVEVKVMLPAVPDDDLVSFIAEWETKHPYNPRSAEAEPS
jgi:DnaJ-class molecular chaperone